MRIRIIIHDSRKVTPTMRSLARLALLVCWLGLWCMFIAPFCSALAATMGQDEQEQVTGRATDILPTSTNQILPNIEYD